MLHDSAALPSGVSVDGHMDSRPHIKIAIHGKFYQWASLKIDDKVVLDAGCGTGYGSALLAEKAREVVAVDADAGIVAEASASHMHAGLAFEVMDCESMDFASDSFDVVVSNALLEYLHDVPAFVMEAHRVLKEGGLFLCGTKNLDLSLKNADGSPRYRNHRQEFDPESFRRLLEMCFSDVEILGERMKARSEAYIMNEQALKIEDLLVRLRLKRLFPRGLRDRVRAMITGVELREIGPGDFEIGDGFVDDALYLVGLGVKRGA